MNPFRKFRESKKDRKLRRDLDRMIRELSLPPHRRPVRRISPQQSAADRRVLARLCREAGVRFTNRPPTERDHRENQREIERMIRELRGPSSRPVRRRAVRG